VCYRSEAQSISNSMRTLGQPMTTRHMCYIVEDQSQVAQREESSFTKKKKRDANQVLPVLCVWLSSFKLIGRLPERQACANVCTVALRWWRIGSALRHRQGHLHVRVGNAYPCTQSACKIGLYTPSYKPAGAAGQLVVRISRFRIPQPAGLARWEITQWS
jgi:hypothetical protein